MCHKTFQNKIMLNNDIFYLQGPHRRSSRDAGSKSSISGSSIEGITSASDNA